MKETFWSHLVGEKKNNAWGASLGKVSFWVILFVFLGMVMLFPCLFFYPGILEYQLYLQVELIKMIFTCVLALLAYNLGKKFYEPLLRIITRKDDDATRE